jgi:hypothetical protein
MPTLRTTTVTSSQATNANGEIEIGAAPPIVRWTVVKGDSASFRIYVEDDKQVAINPNDYSIKADFRRGESLLFSTVPSKTAFDLAGEFTVYLAPGQAKLLSTGDIFDVQLSDPVVVWTVCRGVMNVIAEVTDRTV